MTPEQAGRQRLPRSRQELDAARLLATGGFANQAVSRAYYAAFYAAEEGLLALGESRSKHSGVLSAFNQLVVRPGRIGGEVGRLLRTLFERRNEADYGDVDVEPERVEAVISNAQRFVDAVESWLSSREGQG